MDAVHKAGAIVLSKQDPSLVALLYRAKQDDWSFPKGHIEEGEDVAETTRREIQEETGLIIRFIATLSPMEYNLSNGVQVIVRMFLVQSEDDSTLKIEFEGDKLVWVNYAAVETRLSHDNLKRYYASVYETVEKTTSDIRKSAN